MKAMVISNSHLRVQGIHYIAPGHTKLRTGTNIKTIKIWFMLQTLPVDSQELLAMSLSYSL